MPKVATVLSPGELGGALAGVLRSHGWRVVTSLEGRSARSSDAARSAGMEAAASLAEALREADLVVSAVPPAAALEVAAAVAAAGCVGGGTVFYLDANSVSPATARAVCETVRAAGYDAVDGAVVGAAAALGSAATLYLSGPQAGDVAGLLGDALRTCVLGDEIGRASAFKLAFAGFNKGLVALYLETAMAAERCGSREALMERLAAFYPGTLETIERLLPTYPRHAARRADEMGELAQWLESAGQRAAMARATSDVIGRLAALGLGERERWTAQDVVDACAAAGFLRTERPPR